MVKPKVILEKERFNLTLERLSCQLLEEYDDLKDVCIVGIQTGGVKLASRLMTYLTAAEGVHQIPFGKLDITFYRDDFRTRDKPLVATPMEMNFLVENKKVILVDDVLYTGRSVQAALTALNHYGRPTSVKLLVLADRKFNRNLPIAPDFTGIAIDTIGDTYIKVEWEEDEGEDRVLLI
jgi:pyrimidine operon attenuation protein / uracil phosphoribosyltransferase